MRIPRIYQDVELEPGRRIVLERGAAHHLSRVLRLRDNDPVILFNGRGGEYIASLIIDGKDTLAQINEHIATERESQLDITLLQGISKGDRMDFSLQKAVELGARRIIPVICQRTVVNLKYERREKKNHHWRGIMINACEQSGRNSVPQLDNPIKLTELLTQDIAGLKITLDPEADTRLQDLQPESAKVVLLIGPEGGLTADEIELSKTYGFRGIQLGPRVLRTETATLAAIAALQTQWGDFRRTDA